jgi:hypothetical protein
MCTEFGCHNFSEPTPKQTIKVDSATSETLAKSKNKQPSQAVVSFQGIGQDLRIASN